SMRTTSSTSAVPASGEAISWVGAAITGLVMTYLPGNADDGPAPRTLQSGFGGPPRADRERRPVMPRQHVQRVIHGPFRRRHQRAAGNFHEPQGPLDPRRRELAGVIAEVQPHSRRCRNHFERQRIVRPIDRHVLAAVYA